MATTSIQAIQDRLNLATAAYAAAKKDLDAAIAIRDEYQRQVNVHLQNGDQADANNVSVNLLAPANIAADLAATKCANAKKEVDQVNAELQTAIANLSPTEKTAYLNESQAALTQSQAELAKANYMAGKTKYLVIGVVLVVLIAGTFIYLKRRKKA